MTLFLLDAYEHVSDLKEDAISPAGLYILELRTSYFSRLEWSISGRWAIVAKGRTEAVG